MALEAHGAQVLRIWISGPKIGSTPTKTDLPYNFCFIKILPSLTVEAVDSLQTLFRTPDLWFRVKARCRRSRPDQVNYWEGVLHLLYYKICLKTINHGYRSTWGPGPSRSGFRAKKYDPPPLKQTFPTTFVL
jgi:hypothetical protein